MKLNNISRKWELDWMPEGMMGLFVGVGLILLAWVIWRLGNNEGGFWGAIFGAILDVALFNFDYWGSRTVSMLLFLIGFVVSLLSILTMFGIVNSLQVS